MYTNRTKYIRLRTTIHLTLMMTSAQVVETVSHHRPTTVLLRTTLTRTIKLHYYSPYKVVITISGLLPDDLVT